METYLMMLYVTVEQEKALRSFFTDSGWAFQKPDLSALTDSVGPPLIPKLKLKHCVTSPGRKQYPRKKAKLKRGIDPEYNNEDIEAVKNGNESETNHPFHATSDDVDDDNYKPDDDEDVNMHGQDDDIQTKETHQDSAGHDSKITDALAVTPESSGSTRKSIRLSKKCKQSWNSRTQERKQSENTLEESASNTKTDKFETSCDLCGLSFGTEKGVAYHNSKDHTMIIVKEEDKEQGEKDEGINDEILSPSSQECHICRDKFEEQVTRDKHYLQKHKIHVNSEVRLKRNVDVEETNVSAGQTAGNKKENALSAVTANANSLDPDQAPQNVGPDLRSKPFAATSFKTSPKECQKMGQITQKKEDRNKIPEILFPCSVCDVVCTSRRSFRKHSERHEMNLTKNVRTYSCMLCSERFNKLVVYKGHLKETHGEDYKPDNTQICDYCGKSFKKLDYLKLHIDVIHLGRKKKSRTYKVITGKNHICEVCGAKFTRKNHLAEHIAAKHEGTELNPHNCTLCLKKFPRPCKLEYHMNKDHLNTKPFSCTNCDTTFHSQVTCNNHMRKCTMSEDQMLTCEQCEKKYKSDHNYKLHMQAVHSEPALVCPCGQIVRWQSSVAKHKRRCPLNPVNLGQRMMKRKVLLRKSRSLKKMIVPENAEGVEVSTHAPTVSTHAPTTTIIYQTETGEIIEPDINDVVPQMVAQVNPETSVSMEMSETTQVGEVNTEPLKEVVQGDIQYSVDEQIFTDLVNGVGEQVVEITSSPQQNTDSQVAQENHNVYYVIMKK